MHGPAALGEARSVCAGAPVVTWLRRPHRSLILIPGLDLEATAFMA